MQEAGNSAGLEAGAQTLLCVLKAQPSPAVIGRSLDKLDGGRWGAAPVPPGTSSSLCDLRAIR